RGRGKAQAGEVAQQGAGAGQGQLGLAQQQAGADVLGAPAGGQAPGVDGLLDGGAGVGVTPAVGGGQPGWAAVLEPFEQGADGPGGQAEVPGDGGGGLDGLVALGDLAGEGQG